MEGVIILLGAPNDVEGNLSSIALERCVLAVNVYEQHPGYCILPTGSFGPHFNTSPKPHAHYTRRFLVAKGVPREHILEAAPSRFTREDALLSQPIVEKYEVKNIIVVTSDFHLERAKRIFSDVFAEYRISYLGSPTELPKQQLDALIEHEKRALSQLKF